MRGVDLKATLPSSAIQSVAPSTVSDGTLAATFLARAIVAGQRSQNGACGVSVGRSRAGHDRSHEPANAGLGRSEVEVLELSCLTFQGERYFGCTKTGKFQCQNDAERDGCRTTHNGPSATTEDAGTTPSPALRTQAGPLRAMFLAPSVPALVSFANIATICFCVNTGPICPPE